MRLFVALPAPPAVQACAGAWQSGLTARFIPAPQWHLTLAFLGATEEARLPALQAMLQRLGLHDFTLTLNDIGFSSGSRVVWLTLAEHPPLQALHAALAEALRDEGFPVEARAFHPHVTIARFKRKSDGEEWKNYRARVAALLPVTAQWRGPVLFSSVTASSGSRYEAL
ncbi:MAG: RNA 2',3'-cyclic phosphodiesterase [Alphaproteobacteria bacterium]|nr:RNA 2',3'-cyclic phosphodiesterase [Alphaproteobacteria bacterium]